jgi:hypothetical protein
LGSRRKIAVVESLEGRERRCSECGNTLSTALTESLLEHFFEMSYLFLNFAEVAFGFAFNL